MMTRMASVVVGVMIAFFSLAAFGAGVPISWTDEWPRTDFSKSLIDFGEILSGGPPKDGIPAIDDPRFVTVPDAAHDLDPREPVVGLVVGGDARAYPLRILTWHEIVNDEVGGKPVTVTYCPLCNSAIAFDRRLDGKVLDFGTTGKLRNSDLVMYDRQTESWWQQFEGRAVVGDMAGAELTMIPSRLESFESFRARFPLGRVLVATDPDARDYGRNPYVGYDSAAKPFLYHGAMPEGIEPMARVVAVDGEAWSLDLLRQRGMIRKGDLTLRWAAGQTSALDKRLIAKGRDVGNVTVTRRGADGREREAVYHVTFAFVFHAFEPDGMLHLR